MIGAFFNGIIGFIAIIFALVFFAEHPGVFWGVLFAFAFIAVLGLINGLNKQKTNIPKGRGPGNLYVVPNPDDDDEGDIRHHHDFGGQPHNISSPETIQKKVFSDDDEDERNR